MLSLRKTMQKYNFFLIYIFFFYIIIIRLISVVIISKLLDVLVAEKCLNGVNICEKKGCYMKKIAYFCSRERGRKWVTTPHKLRPSFAVAPLAWGKKKGIVCDLTIHAAFALIFVISGENGGTQISIKKFAAAQYLLSEDVMEGI